MYVFFGREGNPSPNKGLSSFSSCSNYEYLFDLSINYYLFSRTHVIFVGVVIDIEYSIVEDPYETGRYEKTDIFIINNMN